MEHNHYHINVPRSPSFKVSVARVTPFRDQELSNMPSTSEPKMGWHSEVAPQIGITTCGLFWALLSADTAALSHHKNCYTLYMRRREIYSCFIEVRYHKSRRIYLSTRVILWPRDHDVGGISCGTALWPSNCIALCYRV